MLVFGRVVGDFPTYLEKYASLSTWIMKPQVSESMIETNTSRHSLGGGCETTAPRSMNHQRINRQGDLTVFVKTQCCWLVTEIFKASLFFKPQEMGEYETVLSLCVLMLMDPCQKETSVPSVDSCSTICIKFVGPTSDCPNFRFWSLWMIKKNHPLNKNTSSNKNLATQKPQENLLPNFGVPALRKRKIITNAIWGIRTSLGNLFSSSSFRLAFRIPKMRTMSSWWWLIPESCKSKRSGFCFFLEIHGNFNDFGIQTNKRLFFRVLPPRLLDGFFFNQYQEGKPPESNGKIYHLWICSCLVLLERDHILWPSSFLKEHFSSNPRASQSDGKWYVSTALQNPE